MTLAWDSGGDGPALILIHGTGSSRAAWDSVVPLLAPRRRVFVIDLPGCGSPPAPPPRGRARRPRPGRGRGRVGARQGPHGLQRDGTVAGRLLQPLGIRLRVHLPAADPDRGESSGPGGAG